MTEILTESFCERCGTRYTFESARPRARLKGVRVLSRGLRNFVLSDDTSMDEAMAAARSEADREASAHQLDAFHETFNFCMSCRQYTCPNCWNEADARCLSCAPLAFPENAVGVDDLRGLRETILIGEAGGNGSSSHEHVHMVEALASIEPSETDTPAVMAGEAEAEAEAEPDAVEVAEPEAVAAADLAAVAGPTAPPEVEAQDAALPEDAAGKAASQTIGLLRRFRPGQSLDAELEAYERERSDSPASEVHPAAAARAAAAAPTDTTAPADTDAPADADIAAGAAAPTDDVAGLETGLSATEQPAPATATAPADVVEQPTWRITAPDPGGTDPTTPNAAPGAPVLPQPPAASLSGEPQWPARPEWPAATNGLPFLGRSAIPQGGIEALWAASNQELVTAPPVPGKAAAGIQPCVSCGLSLSATARFCRRCGTLQTR